MAFSVFTVVQLSPQSTINFEHSHHPKETLTHQQSLCPYHMPLPQRLTATNLLCCCSCPYSKHFTICGLR